jgi:hypothetical protein
MSSLNYTTCKYNEEELIIRGVLLLIPTDQPGGGFIRVVVVFE